MMRLGREPWSGALLCGPFVAFLTLLVCNEPSKPLPSDLIGHTGPAEANLAGDLSAEHVA
jgi:hypothetical protein